MAICVSDSRNAAYDGNLSTANGFYRAEAGNLAFMTTEASLTSTVNYPITFTNAGNLMGVAVCLIPVTPNTINRPLKIELQELVGGTTWTARTSKELTAIEICVTPTTNTAAGYDANEAGLITAFKFATPYAVNTTAGIWRLVFTSTAGLGSWSIRQAVSGVYSLIAWCDTQISFTDNVDQFVAADPIILDQAFTLAGALQASETYPIAYSGWVCSGTDRSPANVCNLKWDDAPATSYTVTCTGMIAMGAASGFRAGTDELNPIPIAQAGKLMFKPSLLSVIDTGSTRDNVGFCSMRRVYGTSLNLTADASSKGGNFFIYGEIPAVERTTLAADALAAQNIIVTSDATGWVAGDELVVSKKESKAATERDSYLIASVAGDGITITLTQNINAKKLAGGIVTRLNGYGFMITSMNKIGSSTTQFDITNTSGTIYRYKWDGNGTAVSWTLYNMPIHSYVVLAAQNFNAANNGTFRIVGYGTDYIEVDNPSGVVESNKTIGTGYILTQQHGLRIGMPCPNNFVISGCQIDNVGFMLSVGTLNYQNKIGGDLKHEVKYSTVVIRNNLSCHLFPASVGIIPITPPMIGLEISYCTVFRGSFQSDMYVANGQGLLNVHHNYSFQADVLASYTNQFRGLWYCEDNVFHDNYGTSQNVLISYGIAACRFNRNSFWGCNAATNIGTVKLAGTLNMIMTGNKFDNCQCCYYVGSGTNICQFTKSFQDEFGQLVANTYDYVVLYSSYHNFQSEDSVGVPIIYFYGNDQTSSSPGSSFIVTKENGVEGADRIIKQEGTLYKAGTGLSDTTNHNEDYSLKFVPATVSALGYTFATPDLLTWSQKIPTENIQNKDMMVGVWIKLHNAAYWANTHQMPRITINYDNGTEVYGEAAQTTDWQFVFAPFTPLTTYGELTVTISGKTDAGTTNSPFYVAEMSVLYPAGHNIEMGKFNTWSNSLPTSPSISTTVSAADVWAVDPTLFGAATVGAKVNAIKTDTGLIPALL